MPPCLRSTRRGVAAARGKRRPPARAAIVWLATALALLPSAAAQDPVAEQDLGVLAYALQHQPAAEAVQLIHPLLSRRGTIELQPAGNTVVVRDVASVLTRVERLLGEFDHPSRRLRLEIHIVRALPQGEEAPDRAALPPELVRQLRDLLRYESYRLMASAAVAAREGEDVEYRVAREYRVSFRLGTLLADRRIKLHGFRLARGTEGAPPRQLIHTNLNLWLDKPMILGLARSESSPEALMLVLTCRLDAAAAG